MSRLPDDWKNRCAAILPCFNESAHIGKLIPQIQRHISRVIIVNDGSSDDTVEIAKKSGAEILRHPQNLGKGRALQTGWRHAQKYNFDWILMLDGDGQHSPDDIPKFFQTAEKTGASFVIGNRMGDSTKMPFLRRMTNRWMSRQLSKLTGVELPDSQCGFRLVHLPTLQKLRIQANRFEIESEMLLQFLHTHERVAFVAIQTIYKNTRSKIHPAADGWRWFCWWRRQRRKLFSLYERNSSPLLENGIARNT